MRRFVPGAALCFCLIPALCAGDVKLNSETTVSFATAEEAKRLLAAEDDFVIGMSPFDRSARMKTDRAVTKQEFCAFAAASVLDWKPEEEAAIEAAVTAIAPRLSEFQLRFPKSVVMIKTTGKEEGGAAYTRGNAIVLPQHFARSRSEGLQKNITHELFHVLSRHDLELREALYASIGFLPCNEIEFPAELKSRKITNPDGPHNNHCIQVTSEGKPISVVPILYSSEPKYDVGRGGEFFQYLTFKLLVVEKSQADWRPLRRDDHAVCVEPRQVSRLLEQVGKNTGYIIHPEEILADNFALIVAGRKGLPSPEVADRIEKLLRDRRAGDR
jgi:hypothetical protein